MKKTSDSKKIVILDGGSNRIRQGIEFDYCCVHASFALNSVFPFTKLPGADCIPATEMKSTGEVMGIDKSFEIVDIDREFQHMGFTLFASIGTGRYLNDKGIDVVVIQKISEGRPNTIDYIKNNEISLIINTPSGKKPRKDIVSIRRFAIEHGVPLVTTISGVKATASAIRKLNTGKLLVSSLQKYYSCLGKK